MGKKTGRCLAGSRTIASAYNPALQGPCTDLPFLRKRCAALNGAATQPKVTNNRIYGSIAVERSTTYHSAETGGKREQRKL